MAEYYNIFSLLDTKDDASTIIAAALATVKAQKSQDNKKTQKIKMDTKTQGNVNNPMVMTKTNPKFLLHVLRRQRERSAGQHPHPVANGNGNSNNGFLRGNLYNNKPQKKENLVDDDGWQTCHGRRGKGELAPDNQRQNGGGLQQFNGRRNGNFNVYGGGYRRGMRSYMRNKINRRWEEKSDVSGKQLQNANNGETINLNGVESKNPESCKVEAGKDCDETTTVTEGQKDTKESKKEGQEAQVNSKIPKKKQDDDEKLEKTKAAEALKQTGLRKVVLDKDFESMLLVEKKKNYNEEEIAVKQNSALAKKKDSIKGEKFGKVMSIDEFLKPANGKGEWRRRQKGRLNDKDKNGEETKSLGNGSAAEIIIVDADQFPALGRASKY